MVVLDHKVKLIQESANLSLNLLMLMVLSNPVFIFYLVLSTVMFYLCVRLG